MNRDDRNNDNKKQSIWNRDIFELLEEQATRLGNYIEEKEQVSLEEFINQNSKKIDEYILELIKKEKVEYIGGTFEIILVEPEGFYLDIIVSLYFKKMGKIYSRIIEKRKLPVQIYLNEEAFKEMRHKVSVKFEINAPQ